MRAIAELIHPLPRPIAAPATRGGMGGHPGLVGSGSGRSPPRQIGHVPRCRSHQSMRQSAWKKWPHAGSTRTSSSPLAYSDRQMAHHGASSSADDGAGADALPFSPLPPVPVLAAFVLAWSYVMSVAGPSACSTSCTAAATGSQAPAAAATMATMSTTRQTTAAISSTKAVSGVMLVAWLLLRGAGGR